MKKPAQRTARELKLERQQTTMADEEQFESTSSGASATYPKQCSALRKNEFVVIKGRPTKIVEMSTSKTGKHGHAKVHIVALDVFSGKKFEDICPSTHNMEVPVVTRNEYTVLSAEDGFLSLMDEQGACREDLKVPDKGSDLGKEIDTKLEAGEPFMVTVLKAMLI
ncbi:eukaryotic translation initiation factor 5A-1-like isoform X2 [Littorina saxatilis]|uniref:eukaryotic translation initiation factor 5A-1-like isoform X2 n=1 Tax=Littorina saxatilis TaxID=31220 RepID=UPI0038B68F3B